MDPKPPRIASRNTPADDARAVGELDEMLGADTLRPEDREALGAIFGRPSLIEMIDAIVDYYRDRDRADRTPRAFLYLHLGILTSACDRLREAMPAPTTLNAAAAMLEASAAHLEPLAVGYGAEQMRSIARRLREGGR